MRRDQDFGMADERMIGRRWLGLEHVNRRAGDLGRGPGPRPAPPSSIKPPRAQLMIRTVGLIRAISAGRSGSASRPSAACERQEVATAPKVVEPNRRSRRRARAPCPRP